MISEEDRAYFEGRLAQELRRAEDAALPEVAATHRQLADRYRTLLEAGVEYELVAVK